MAVEKSGTTEGLAQIAASIVNSFSLPSFSFIVSRRSLSSEVTANLYENNVSPS
ncbi:MAG TPA: hypothetical protein VNI77_02065 [Nitrososphaera sp.]|nr:hypothetical protein [Nitrososphaera sp.]